MLCAFLLLLTIVFFSLIRYRLRDMPLERDEGEYAYAGQLLAKGIPPYKLAYNMKLPGVYVAYADIMKVFGETPGGIHIGLLLLNATTTLLVFFLTARLFGRLAGLAAAASYALLSTSSSVMGFQAHATNFVVLPAVLGVFLLLLALRSQRMFLFFASGLFLGIAFLMKQHGMFFVLFCLVYLGAEFVREKMPFRRVAQYGIYFAIGSALPYGLTCLWLFEAGVFREFWFWTVTYSAEYSKMGLRRGAHNFFENFPAVAGPAVPIWIIAAIGLTALIWSPPARRQAWFLAGLLFFSFLSLLPGTQFRPHYFVLLLPITAILAGVAVSAATDRLARQRSRFLTLVPVLVFLAAGGFALVRQWRFYFSFDPSGALRETYKDAPFVEAPKVADYIREHSGESSRIAVLGSEPEIYFYARRTSATAYIYMYEFMRPAKYTARMREEMIAQVEATRPEYVVYVATEDSWGVPLEAPLAADVFAWVRDYTRTQYEKVGVVEMGEQTRYVWGDEAKTYMPASSKAVYVFKRKN